MTAQRDWLNGHSWSIRRNAVSLEKGRTPREIRIGFASQRVIRARFSLSRTEAVPSQRRLLKRRRSRSQRDLFSDFLEADREIDYKKALELTAL